VDANAEVAQLVEQWIENPCVGGSSPPLGTTFANLESVSFINLGLADFCFDSGFDSNWDQVVSRRPCISVESGMGYGAAGDQEGLESGTVLLVRRVWFEPSASIT
jgi:hypothetical protein